MQVYDQLKMQWDEQYEGICESDSTLLCEQCGYTALGDGSPVPFVCWDCFCSFVVVIEYTTPSPEEDAGDTPIYRVYRASLDKNFDVETSTDEMEDFDNHRDALRFAEELASNGGEWLLALVDIDSEDPF